MGFNTRVVLHVLCILLTISLLAWCLSNTHYYATMLSLTLLLAFQVAVLLRYVQSTNRQLARFMEAVRHVDLSQNFQQRGLSNSFQHLGEAFDGLIKHFRQQRSEREAQANYLHAFVNQLPIPVLALAEDDSIPVSNTALRRLLGRQHIHHLRQLADFDTRLAAGCRELMPVRESVLEISREGEVLFLALSCSILRSEGQQQKLISIQNIQNAMEAREMLAWQNLIRVMTHEIMNSITPITSLANTASAYLQEIQASSHHSGEDSINRNDNDDVMKDIDQALTIIRSRGEALMHFVANYRSLSQLPAPVFRRFRIDELFTRVLSLMTRQARESGFSLTQDISPASLDLHADPDLLEQALINLINNAFEAKRDAVQSEVRLTAALEERGCIRLQVVDNGKGISPDIQDSIFIPFFTTKQAGSGIGMSIVKQIVSLNGGRINVQSSPGQGTVVTLNF